MDKREKYKLAFKTSKAKVKIWENEFMREYNRKPSKEEMKLAPPKILICYKNCWKIKAYFDEEDRNKKKNSDVFEEEKEDTPSFSGIFPSDQERNTACTDISNIVGPINSEDSLTLPQASSLASTLPSSGVWGSHLNVESNVSIKKSGLTNFEKLSTKLSLNVTSPSTRKSLKKKVRKKGNSFFDTLGDSQNSSDLSNSLPITCSSLPTPTPTSSLPITPFSSRPPSPEGNLITSPKAAPLPSSLNDSELGAVFPCLAVEPRVSDTTKAASVMKVQALPTMSRTVDAAWLARCGLTPSSEDSPIPRSTLPNSSFSTTGGANSREGKIVEPVYQIPEVDCQDGKKEVAEIGKKVEAIEWKEGIAKKEIIVGGKDDEPGNKDDTTVVAQGEYSTKASSSILSSVNYSLSKVKQVKMTMEELEEEAMDNIDDDPDFVIEKLPSGSRNKRKRKQNFDSDSDDEKIFESGDDTEKIPAVEAKEMGKKVVKKSSGRGGIRKKKKVDDYTEEDPVDDDTTKSNDNIENKPVGKIKRVAKKVKKAVVHGRSKRKNKLEDDFAELNDEEEGVSTQPVNCGPTDMNLFALGFEEVEVKELKVRKSMTQGERLAMKVNTGKASENFLKIDLKKKSFAKGKNSGAKMKRYEYKKKLAMKEGTKIKEFKCFKCGQVGHWANQCTGGLGDNLIPESMANEFDPGDFPTLEQARDMATGVVSSTISSKLFIKKTPHLETGVEMLKPEPDTEVGSGPVSEAVFEVATETVLDNIPESSLVPSSDVKLDESRSTSTQETARSTSPSLDFETTDDADLLEACRQFECAKPESAASRYAVAPIQYDREKVRDALSRWGHQDFRPGQEEAVMRILNGQSTLVLLATGTGKSLIYQLPSLLYRETGPCITLVVSPLVSLMEDQVTGLPSFLRAAALHYNMTQAQKDKVCDQVKSGRLHFLLVSPEAVAGGGGAFGSLLPHLPPIAFVCIDEAHCVSHWSHNFRPSYLRLAKVIREKLGVRTILGLTATAPESITQSVAHHLGVPEDGVIRGPLLPGNLTMTVSRDVSRDEALLHMLTDGQLAECDSVIVYCTRRDECERLATIIRTRLQIQDQKAERKGNKSRVSVTAEPYHAGMTSHKRKTVQNHFMSGKLRVVVATVAFGMGIDKSDIRAIVHYNMPKTFESYIQEIGRAGRDGLPARGHLFLDSKAGGDLSELRRHIFSNSVDRHTIAKLLRVVFPPRDVEGKSTEKQEVAVSVAELVEQLDIPEENISTLLCYLENYDPPYLSLENPVYCQAKVQCYGGPRQLRQVAAKSPPLAAAIALQRKAGADLSLASSVEFPVVDVAARMNWDSSIVKKELKNLEWLSSGSGWKRTGVVVEFSDLAFHFFSVTGLEEDEQDALLEELYKRVDTREKTELHGLARLAKAFSAVSYGKILELGEDDVARSDKLKGFIQEYFQETARPVIEAEERVETCEHEGQVRSDIRAFVCQHQDHVWSGRAVARIFHGIQSPNFPAQQWGKVRGAWRKHLDVDFNLLVRMATQEVLSLRKGAR